MALTLLKTPNPIDFFNGLNFKINCPLYIQNPGSFASFNFHKVAPALPGSFYIQTPIGGLGFQFGDGYSIQPRKLTLTDDINITAAEFNSFTEISDYYNVTIVNDRIVFTGKYPFQMATYFMSWFESAEPFTYVAESDSLGSDIIDNSEYRLNVSLKYNDTMIDMDFYPDSDANIEFDFFKFFSSKLAGEIAATDNTAILKNNILTDYILEFKEFDNQTLLSVSHFTGKTFPGKMDIIQYLSYNYASSGFLNTFQKTEIYKSSLHYIHYRINDVARFYLKIFYNDNTTSESEIFNYDLQEPGIIFIPCGLPQNNMESYFIPDKLWNKYEIYSDINPDDKVTFILKQKPLDARQFIFANIYGLYETITFTGIQSEVAKRDFSTVELYSIQNMDNVIDSVIRNIYTEYEINSGLKLKSEIPQIKQLFASKNIYIHDLILNKFVRVHLISEDLSGIDDEKEIFDFTFKYRRYYNN